MNNRILKYAQMVSNGEMTLRDIPANIRKDVISKLRELLAIADAMKEESSSPLHTKAA